MCHRTKYQGPLTVLCQQGGEQFEQLKHKLQRGLAQAVKRLTARIAAFQQQLDDSEKAEASRKQADMLMANVYRCMRSLDAQAGRLCKGITTHTLAAF